MNSAQPLSSLQIQGANVEIVRIVMKSMINTFVLFLFFVWKNVLVQVQLGYH